MNSRKTSTMDCAHQKFNCDFNLGKNNADLCSLCGRKIPKEILRFVFKYRGWGGVPYFRLCGLCIVRLANQADTDDLDQWAKVVFIEEL